MKKGFTLIELLIVIAIIGVLAVALLPTISGGPGKARDAARTAALSQIVQAVENYNLDLGKYPEGRGCLGKVAVGNPTAALEPYFKSGTPKDPSSTWINTAGPDCEGQYLYVELKNAAGTKQEGYVLATTLEKGTNNVDMSAALADPLTYIAAKALMDDANENKNYAVLSK